MVCSVGCLRSWLSVPWHGGYSVPDLQSVNASLEAAFAWGVLGGALIVAAAWVIVVSLAVGRAVARG